MEPITPFAFTNTGYRKPTPVTPPTEAVATIPTSYSTDLSQIPVMMQSQIPDCVENAVCYALEYLILKNEGRVVQFSRRFLASLTAAADGFPFIDGTSLKIALQIAKDYGICEASYFNDDHSLALDVFADKTKITPEAYANAEQYKKYFENFTFLTDAEIMSGGIKSSIYEHGLVLVAMDIDQSWWTSPAGVISWAAADILPIRPPIGRTLETDPTLSGHAVPFYGYDESKVYFRNEWSTQWGNNGDGEILANDIPFIYEAAYITYIPATVADTIQKQVTEVQTEVQNIHPQYPQASQEENLVERIVGTIEEELKVIGENL